jgi:hypothetical protein
MKLIYIAGKVTGEPFRETAIKFEKAHNEIKGKGFDAIVPIEVVQDYLIDHPEKALLPEKELWQLAMKLCISHMVECDAVLLLEDFSQSKGALIEAQLALDLGIPRFLSIQSLVKHFNENGATSNLQSKG